MPVKFALLARSNMRHRRRAFVLKLNRFKRQLRDREARVIAFSCGLGLLVGGAVTEFHKLLLGIQELVFGMSNEAMIGGTGRLPSWHYALVPVLGGLMLGMAAHVAERLRPIKIIDPIEANALYGGHMSFGGSVRLAWLTMVSNLSGASVGMEAAYSQLGASLHAVAARFFVLRREDRRSLTTAGAAAAIAAAFDAPLAGAFYGFELVHGTYSPRNLAIVGFAVVASTIARRMLDPGGALFVVQYVTLPTEQILPLIMLVGVLAAVVGIATMRLVSVFERMFSAFHVPRWLRPCLGGAMVGGLALWNPQILGSGHDAIEPHILLDAGWVPITLLLLGKITASALSLGVGFRGGLFSSSLFIGCLLGAALFTPLAALFPGLAEARVAFMLVGMAAVGAAITGAPLTMVFLILEIANSLSFTVSVLVCALTAATIVRLTFGYSFSTWRFHLRGIPVLGAHDVGWVQDLTAERLMRTDYQTIPITATLAEIRSRFPLGSARYAVAVDPAGRFAGMIDISQVHDPKHAEVSDQLCGADVASPAAHFVEKGSSIQKILDAFSASNMEILPVIESPATMRLAGTVSEAYCLRRYANELEGRRRDEIGAP